MPALVKSRFGESGSRLEDGTIVCCFSRKKSRKLWRTWLLVMMELIGGKAPESNAPRPIDKHALGAALLLRQCPHVLFHEVVQLHESPAG